MLQKISLTNYALADQVEIELGKGLNIITGETGAGKSILVGAVAALLGEKPAFQPLRDAAKKAVVEGFFVNCLNDRIRDLLIEKEIDLFDDDSFIVRREFHTTGRTRSFINDTPVPGSVLSELSTQTIDLHGQHEHQSLLNIKTHLSFLDSFAQLGRERDAVTEAYNWVQSVTMELRKIENQKENLQKQHEINLFQIEEIASVNPLPEEDENLKQEVNLLSNAERRSELAQIVIQNIFEKEDSIHSLLAEVLGALDELAAIDPSLKSLLDDCKAAEVSLSDTGQELQSYCDDIEFDANLLETQRQRLARLQSLQRKYGGSLSDVISHWHRLEESVSKTKDLDGRIEELAKELEHAQADYSKLAIDLRSKRKIAAKELQKLVPEVLKELGLPHTKFEIRFEFDEDPQSFLLVEGKRVKASRDGIDMVEFYISTNKGQNAAPLAKVASGGEISRIMLALKSVLAERDSIPILIFDEIDNGVSGRIAQACGRRLQKLSASHQIICITHLPQIASAGQNHYYVEKKDDIDKTVTVVRKLENSERTAAIASLLGGEKISRTHLESAEELLKEAGHTFGC